MLSAIDPDTQPDLFYVTKRQIVPLAHGQSIYRAELPLLGQQIVGIQRHIQLDLCWPKMLIRSRIVTRTLVLW